MKRFIALSAIVVPEARQRREFKLDELNELSESIQTNGLIHAPTLRLDGDHYTLVAGERRLRAIRDLYELGGTFSYDSEPVAPGLVPYTFLGDLSPIEAMEIELEENIRRTDLTWQERATATDRLMELRTLQADSLDKLPPTVADIAEEIRGSRVGSYQVNTRKEILVAKHLNNPAVAAAKNVDDAYKILKKEEATRKNLELAEMVGETYSHALHRAILGDSLEELRKIPAESIDCVVTDPPYGMGADEFGDSGKGGDSYGEHSYEDSSENFFRTLETLPGELFRVLKPDSHLYLFCDFDRFHSIKHYLSDAGFRVFRTPLIWHKPTAFRSPWPDMGPQRKYELILFAVKGSRKVNSIAPDVLTYNPDTNLGHQAQKPVALFRDLLSRSTLPGDSILDPFAGSGPIFPAAHSLRLRATGIEIDASHYGKCLERIQGLKDPQPEIEGL